MVWIFVLFLSISFLFFFLISKVIYFLWDWLVAEKMGRKEMERNILALGFMLVLKNSDC